MIIQHLKTLEIFGVMKIITSLMNQLKMNIKNKIWLILINYCFTNRHTVDHNRKLYESHNNNPNENRNL